MDAAVGARLLGDVEEESLEEVSLGSLRPTMAIHDRFPDIILTTYLN